MLNMNINLKLDKTTKKIFKITFVNDFEEKFVVFSGQPSIIKDGEFFVESIEVAKEIVKQENITVSQLQKKKNPRSDSSTDQIFNAKAIFSIIFFNVFSYINHELFTKMYIQLNNHIVGVNNKLFENPKIARIFNTIWSN